MLEGKVAIKEFFYKEYCDRDADTRHVTVPTSGNRDVALYNFKVNDEARDKEHKGLIVTYRDGIVHHYDYASSESMGWILSIMPFANDIQSLSMTARMTTSPITTKAEFNTVADITDEESRRHYEDREGY